MIDDRSIHGIHPGLPAGVPGNQVTQDYSDDSRIWERHIWMIDGNSEWSGMRTWPGMHYTRYSPAAFLHAVQLVAHGQPDQGLRFGQRAMSAGAWVELGGHEMSMDILVAMVQQTDALHRLMEEQWFPMRNEPLPPSLDRGSIFGRFDSGDPDPWGYTWE